jgi:hypothetical protein
MTDTLIGRHHRPGHDTERAAAESMQDHTERLRALVLRTLLDNPAGLTDDEGGAIIGGDRLRFGRRRNELVRAGLVEKTTVRRPTGAGRTAIVWRAVA